MTQKDDPSPRGPGVGPAVPVGMQVRGPGRDPVHAGAHVWSVGTDSGSMTLSDGVLRLSAEVDHGLYLAPDRHRPALDDVDCIDARRVTFLACPGLRLLAQVAEARAASLPLWASPAVLRLLHLTGLHTLFDLRS